MHLLTMCTCCERQDSKQQGAPVGFDQWVKLVLKDRYGSAAREAVPENLLRLVDELAPEH